MLETAEERVKLLKKGFTGKEIEMLYIKSNHFKIIRSPILFDALEFDFNQNICVTSLFKDKRKTKSTLILAIFILILVLVVPVSIIFLDSLLLLLFVPPMSALTVILAEGTVVISNELNELSSYIIILNGNSL